MRQRFYAKGWLKRIAPVAEFALLIFFLMHIPKPEHGQELLFFLSVEAAGGAELARVAVSTEEHVPPHDVAVIVGVFLVLMVNAVHFGTLKNVADPLRSAHVGMVEKFA